MHRLPLSSPDFLMTGSLTTDSLTTDSLTHDRLTHDRLTHDLTFWSAWVWRPIDCRMACGALLRDKIHVDSQSGQSKASAPKLLGGTTMTIVELEPVERTPEPLFGVAAQLESGWFDDPSGQHRLRYHDGSKWSEHVTHFGPTPCTSCGGGWA